MADRNPAQDTQMDANDLWREEVISDRKIGTLRVLYPILAAGAADAARKTQFIGEVQLYTNMGPLPVTFEVEANSLAQAVERFGDSAREASEKTVRELQELRRQSASSLVLPGQQGAAGFGAGGLPPGIGGGGKIQMP